MKKMFLTGEQVEEAVHDIASQMWKDNWRPDYVVGITRGGLLPAILLSHQYSLSMHTLDVRLRDATGQPESNYWMSEDAFGYVPEEERELHKCRWDPSRRKKILIVDDINDTGATFNWIKQDWPAGCLPNEESWNTVWGGNVRFASIVDNLSSDTEVHYSSIEINKEEEDKWIVFPWEKK
jgi:hypoxanthine phosphoribosyltransferase